MDRLIRNPDGHRGIAQGARALVACALCVAGAAASGAAVLGEEVPRGIVFEYVVSGPAGYGLPQRDGMDDDASRGADVGALTLRGIDGELVTRASATGSLAPRGDFPDLTNSSSLDGIARLDQYAQWVETRSADQSSANAIRLADGVRLTGGYESLDSVSPGSARPLFDAPRGSEQLQLDVVEALASVTALRAGALELNILGGIEGQSASGLVEFGGAGRRSQSTIGAAARAGVEASLRLGGGFSVSSRALGSAGPLFGGLDAGNDLQLTGDYAVSRWSRISVGVRRGGSELSGRSAFAPGARINRDALTVQWKVEF
ncbi:hypothetical protein BH11PLA1_BH11PLA1_14970 [soil metagenome]